jgi:5-methylcytosine-specific restriction endonuclease McrA
MRYYGNHLHYAYERKSITATAKGKARAARSRYRYRSHLAALTSGDATLTTAEWEAIKHAQGGACLYCTRTDRPLTQEHVVPISKGGHHTRENVVAVCQPCNSRRRNGPQPVPGAWRRRVTRPAG